MIRSRTRFAAAYGKRAITVPDLTPVIRWKDGEHRAVTLIQRETTVAGGDDSDSRRAATSTVWYWLVKSVTQPQDRTLLPSDEEYPLAAPEGIRDYVDEILGEHGSQAACLTRLAGCQPAK